MERIFKFRAWFDKTNPKMKYFDQDEVEDAGYWHDTGRCILMQYTGVKDINNKEIYEGDILKSTYFKDKYEIFKVKWEDVFDYCLGMRKVGFNLPFRHDVRIEVIGNIYENPELMENK